MLGGELLGLSARVVRQHVRLDKLLLLTKLPTLGKNSFPSTQCWRLTHDGVAEFEVQGTDRHTGLCEESLEPLGAQQDFHRVTQEEMPGCRELSCVAAAAY